jgi:hypothetical protein
VRACCARAGLALSAPSCRHRQDATLLRFLKARQGSVDKAHAMLLKCIDWRAQQDISRRAPAPMLTQPLAQSTQPRSEAGNKRSRSREQSFGARAAPCALRRAQQRVG